MSLPRPSDLSETILVTHDGCSDGSGCAILFLEAGGKQEKIMFVAACMLERWWKDFSPTDQGKFIIIADLGPNL